MFNIMFNLKKCKMLFKQTFNAMIYIVPACLNTRAFLTKETEDNLAWIKYWIVFSLLFALEILLDFQKSCFPCYDYFKVFLLCFCIVSIEINLSTQNSSTRNSIQVISIHQILINKTNFFFYFQSNDIKRNKDHRTLKVDFISYHFHDKSLFATCTL